MCSCKTCNLASGLSKRKALNKMFGRGQDSQLLKKHRPPEGTPCEICNTPMVYQRSARLMCFDHDPNTHEFRGWLCQNCNTALGKLGDDIDGLKRAMLYLINSTKPNETR